MQEFVNKRLGNKCYVTITFRNLLRFVTAPFSNSYVLWRKTLCDATFCRSTVFLNVASYSFMFFNVASLNGLSNCLIFKMSSKTLTA
jgi:hypothetical protein